MHHSAQLVASDRIMRSTGSAILWSVVCGGVAGTLIGMLMSFAQPLLVSTRQLDFEQAVATSIQGSLILFWYLVPFGLFCGVVVGLLLGLTYPLTLKLSGREKPPALYATLLGIIVFALGFDQVNSVNLFLNQTLAPNGWLIPGLMGLTSAVVAFFIARLTVYRPQTRSTD